MNDVEILLIEDNEDDAALTIRALKKQNLADRLLHVRDGAQALEFLYGGGMYRERDIEKTPKVILLDLKMPKVNGLEVLERIKSEERTQSIPVVVFTSSQGLSDIEACYKKGVNSYIVKPIEFESFIQAVSELGLYWVLLNRAGIE